MGENSLRDGAELLDPSGWIWMGSARSSLGIIPSPGTGILFWDENLNLRKGESQSQSRGCARLSRLHSRETWESCREFCLESLAGGRSQVIPGDLGLGGFPASCRNPGIQKEVWEVSLRGFPWEFQGLFWAPFPETLACFHGKASGAGADPALVPLQPPENCPGLESMDFTQKSGFT